MAKTLVLRLLIAGVLIISPISATDHIVGKRKGWNPGINYTDWVNGERFIVGDMISFRYQKGIYDVLQVNETAYGNCSSDNPIGNWTSGKDFIYLNESKRYFFICGRGFCYSGMKLTIFVEKPASPTPPPEPQNSRSSTDSGRWFHRRITFPSVSVALVWFLTRF